MCPELGGRKPALTWELYSHNNTVLCGENRDGHSPGLYAAMPQHSCIATESGWLPSKGSVLDAL